MTPSCFEATGSRTLTVTGVNFDANTEVFIIQGNKTAVQCTVTSVAPSILIVQTPVSLAPGVGALRTKSAVDPRLGDSIVLVIEE